jgi:hypothetical protein
MKVKLSEFKAAFVLTYGTNNSHEACVGCECGGSRGGRDLNGNGNLWLEIPRDDTRIVGLLEAFGIHPDHLKYCGPVVSYKQYELPADLFDLEG